MKTTLDEAVQIPQQEATIATLLEQLHAARFSGVILLHWQHGVPRVAEFPAVQIKLQPLPRGGGS